MIQPYSRLKVADNSGARKIMCFKAIGKANPKSYQIGDMIVGSVKEAIPHSGIKKKEIVRAVIVRQKKTLNRLDGSTIRFDDNAVVLVNPDKTPRASRIFGPVARELRDFGYIKIISMATEVL